MALAIHINNSVMVRLTGLKNALTDEYVNNATVAVSLKDIEGAAIPGESWPVTLAYVPGSNGEYRVVLSSALTLAHRQPVQVLITADGAGLQAAFDETLTAMKRAG